MSYLPFRIGSRLRIVPPGTIPEDRLDLLVARGAFGSGEHETTRSCLELLEALPTLEGAEVLDLGSGTGVLAIAALRLGARRATLVDRDPRAAACSREHLELNGVRDRASVIEGELGSLAGEERFDLILANIHGDILVRLAAELAARARPGARLLLSGILWEHNWDVRDRFERAGCELLENRFLEEYSTVLLRLPPRAA